MNPCPKCGYRRRDTDSQVHPDICPACGIAYSKWRTRQAQQPQSKNSSEDSDGIEVEADISRREKLWAALTYVPEQVAREAVWARGIYLALFALWGGYFMFAGLDWEKIGGSFMHNINLPFHEFGHVLFAPFGRFMMILGGSLFQILLPLILLAAFIMQQRDSFAASLMLWWCGQNFIDVAPYIADAPYRALPLVGGGEESHDWGNLLTMMHAIDSAHSLARLSSLFGSSLIILALFWGAWLVRAQWRNSQNL